MERAPAAKKPIAHGVTADTDQACSDETIVDRHNVRWGKRKYKMYTKERRDLPRLMFQISMN